MKNLADKLHDLVSGGNSDLISPRALLVALMSQWGGPEGVARELKKDFDACQVGSTNRIRIGTDLVGALMKFGDDEDGDETDSESVRAKVEELIARQVEEDAD